MNKLTINLFCILLLFFTLFHIDANAQIKLPKLISDGMILQRDVKIPIWGWANNLDKIVVSFNGKKYQTRVTPDGKWAIELPKMKAGGPYTMAISGENNIIIKDILIGDIWLCAGQSNMVHQLDIHDVRYANEIAIANYPEIRQFKIPTTTSISGPLEDLADGEWQLAIGEKVRPFSAVAYFFAKKLYEKNHIPIGLINSSVGGTPIEAWIPKEGYTDFPELLKIIEENKDSVFVNSQAKNQESFNRKSQKITDKGLLGEKPWYAIDFKPKKWRRISIPGYWEDQGVRDLNGVVWYRREFKIPQAMVGKKARVFLGRIVDADELYINGVKVGNKTYQYPQRRYTVPEDLLKFGTNIFVIRVTNTSGKGGFVPDKPYYLFTEKDTIDLKGYWQYKVGEVFKPFDFSAFSKENSEQPSTRIIQPQNEPTSLYNAMIAPFKQYPLKGIIWYQGESNTGNPEIYNKYMQALITGWRTIFNNPNIPFIYAQLPNFMDVSYTPTESNWALLRESQLMALSNPNTAMAVTIDLGEWNDIHPDNKKDVGERMALAALKLAYHENLIYSGPIFESYTIEDHKIILSFSNIGSGLMSNDGEELSEFAIAGEDKKFVWAHAKIEGAKVVVWCEEIKNPKYVRYAWADNPDNPNLYNREGLPASPFRTESTAKEH
tara:strand:+ start:82076 stop:84064 length:1989 start_codon:yes stop_codon:yes gene_type:complete